MEEQEHRMTQEEFISDLNKERTYIMVEPPFTSRLNIKSVPSYIASFRSQKLEHIEIADQYLSRGISLEDCDFDIGLIVKNVDLQYGIKLYNCKIENLIFMDCKSSDMDRHFNSKHFNIEINNCEIRTWN